MMRFWDHRNELFIHLFIFSSRLKAHENTKHNYNTSTKTKKKRLKQTTMPTFNKKFELMLMRRMKAYISFGSVV